MAVIGEGYLFPRESLLRPHYSPLATSPLVYSAPVWNGRLMKSSSFLSSFQPVCWCAHTCGVVSSRSSFKCNLCIAHQLLSRFIDTVFIVLINAEDGHKCMYRVLKNSINQYHPSIASTSLRSTCSQYSF